MDSQFEQLKVKLADLKLRRAGLLSLLEGIAEQFKTPNKDVEFLNRLLEQLEQADKKANELKIGIAEVQLEFAEYKKEMGL
jgi:hypothetical protein